MNRVFSLGIVIVALAVLGCGGSNKQDSSEVTQLKVKVTRLEEKVATLEKENANLKKSPSNGVTTTGPTTGPTPTGPGTGPGSPSVVADSKLRQYFLDLNTGKMFAANRNEVPPIKAPSDKEPGKLSGVKAYVYSCDACSDPNKRVMVYLERFSLEAKAAIEAERDKQTDRDWVIEYITGNEEYQMGHQIRKSDGVEWIQWAGPQGEQIRKVGIAAVKNKCARGKPLRACRP